MHLQFIHCSVQGINLYVLAEEVQVDGEERNGVPQPMHATPTLSLQITAYDTGFQEMGKDGASIHVMWQDYHSVRQW